MSDASADSHHRVQEYSLQRPQQPHILVPPPPFSDSKDGVVSIGNPIFNPDVELNVDFLSDTPYKVIKSLSLPDWQYKNRREAQSVLPFLYLGPSSAAKDKAFIQNEGITMILGITVGQFGVRLLQPALNAAEELGIERESLSANTLSDLIPLFARSNAIISRHLSWTDREAKSNPLKSVPAPKVLVFCESGNEKSAVVVAAYLMATFEKVDARLAMQICHTRRFCCSFEDNLKFLLINYDEILRAQREVGIQRARTPNPPSFSKRGRERDESDMDEDVEMDNERFEGRDQAPFR
jgi:serine/threonine/tyrosine-interacting protein